jgi:hypothetical protein
MAQSEENGYIFIDKIPFIYSKRNVERQQKIETWLDLYQLTSELKIAKWKLRAAQTLAYVS